MARRIHAYAASFGSEFARDLILEYTDLGDIVLDPFLGSATTLVQSRISGRSTIGIDIDPVACLIGRVLTARYALDELDALNTFLVREIQQIEDRLSHRPMDEVTCAPGRRFSILRYRGTIPANPRVRFWFAPVQRMLLASLVSLARSLPDERHKDILNVAISSAIIHKWPHTLSQAMDIDHSRPHRVVPDDLSLNAQSEVFAKALKTTFRGLRELNEFPVFEDQEMRVVQGNTAPALRSLAAESVDYVLSSPPYFNAVDYPRAHQLSQWWLWPRRRITRGQYIGLRPARADQRLVARTRALLPSRVSELNWLRDCSPALFLGLCRYFLDMNNMIRETSRVLKPGVRSSDMAVPSSLMVGRDYNKAGSIGEGGGRAKRAAEKPPG